MKSCGCDWLSRRLFAPRQPSYRCNQGQTFVLGSGRDQVVTFLAHGAKNRQLGLARDDASPNLLRRRRTARHRDRPEVVSSCLRWKSLARCGTKTSPTLSQPMVATTESVVGRRSAVLTVPQQPVALSHAARGVPAHSAHNSDAVLLTCTASRCRIASGLHVTFRRPRGTARADTKLTSMGRSYSGESHVLLSFSWHIDESRSPC